MPAATSRNHPKEHTTDMTTRPIFALAGCVAGLCFAAPAARAADEIQPATNSPIQADSGQVLAAPVHPETTAEGEATCTAPQLFNPLTAFKDQRSYFVAPEGDFENPQLPGWQLDGGASVRDGGSTQAVLGADHAMSLTLPAGSSATSPEMCVDLNYPTFRFFATQLEADTDADLAVDVIYPALAKDNVRQAKKFRLKAKDGWELSDDIKLEPQRLGKQSGWRKVA